ncbi:MAG TPA: helix-turn-helix transcriptional regulator [Actinomycetes bacterium]|jgi:transcriptional regulator with XRE-family HTH domain|nr:helix-turn-helix transcriptional regulator [Actinomycetes bacterium]
MARPPKPLDPSASQAARLGAAVRQRREELGIIQEELAEMILFSRTHLAQVELGKASASEEFVRRCDGALKADGRLLAIYQEVVIERAQQRQRRTRDRRSNSVSRSRRGLRLVPSQDGTVDQASGSAEPGTSSENLIDRHTATSFFGGTRPTITMPLRTLGTGRYVITQEDFEAADALAQFLRRLVLEPAFHYVSPTGEIDLSYAALCVICGPKCSQVIADIIACDPHFSFVPDENGRWRLTERNTGNSLGSPLDLDFPANQDLAYVARLHRPDDRRPFLLIAGVHAVGSRGAVDFLTKPSNLRQLHQAVGSEPFSMVVSCTFTRTPLRILSSEALIAPRTH